MNIVNY